MPYSLILLVIVVAVAVHFVFASNASTPAKTCVAIISLASIALPYAVPTWSLACLLAQVVLVIVLLLYATFHGAG